MFYGHYLNVSDIVLDINISGPPANEIADKDFRPMAFHLK